MKLLKRRLSALEHRKSLAARQVHVICAIDESDRDRQIAEMLATGVLAPSDGLLCILGHPPVQA